MIPIPPPPSAARPIAFEDTECFPNFWLLKIRPRGQKSYVFKLNSGESFSEHDRQRILLLHRAFTMVTFNGLNYDVPMITGALMGYTPEQLKWLNDQMIVNKIKHWELGLMKWAPDDHIDVMEVAPGAGGQKQFAAKLHCKKMQDLPYDPGRVLSEQEKIEVTDYCENDLDVLEVLFDALAPQIKLRVKMGERYGMDLRSKSDAQLAEAVLKKRCEVALGHRIFKPEVNFHMRFKCVVPDFIQFQLPQLQRARALVEEALFGLGPSGAVEMPKQLEGLEVVIGDTTYAMGIGGLHSQEKKLIVKSDDRFVIQSWDVASYYPNLILNSGKFPPSMGEAFRTEYADIKESRLVAKDEQKLLKKSGDTTSEQYEDAEAANEGGKIMLNGSYGKLGSPYSVLFAPEMLIHTTLPGQLSLLMLIEWYHLNGIRVVSANTDGIVIMCPRDKTKESAWLIKQWEERVNLTMELDEFEAIYARDVNTYFAIKNPDNVKRKGEYAKAGLISKKNPDVEICSDAVSDFLAKGIPVEFTIGMCRDIRKFVTVSKVNGGGVKMWGEGPRKGTLVREMVDKLVACGWRKEGRSWRHDEHFEAMTAQEAYAACFEPQRPEYLGKVVRWYYGTNSPGPILYQSNGNTVGGSHGATPCMVLPDEFPDDIDYGWYIQKAQNILKDIGYYTLTA